MDVGALVFPAGSRGQQQQQQQPSTFGRFRLYCPLVVWRRQRPLCLLFSFYLILNISAEMEFIIYEGRSALEQSLSAGFKRSR